MSAGQSVSVDQRFRIPAAILVLGATFLVGAVAGAVVPSIVTGAAHSGSGASTRVVLPAFHTDDMSTAAYAAEYAALGAPAANSSARGDTSSPAAEATPREK